MRDLDELLKRVRAVLRVFYPAHGGLMSFDPGGKFALRETATFTIDSNLPSNSLFDGGLSVGLAIFHVLPLRTRCQDFSGLLPGFFGCPDKRFQVRAGLNERRERLLCGLSRRRQMSVESTYTRAWRSRIRPTS